MIGNGVMGTERERKLRLDGRKKFLPVRMVRHWNRLIGEAVDALILQVCKTGLDEALSSLV